jgi:hypothetical protein
MDSAPRERLMAEQGCGAHCSTGERTMSDLVDRLNQDLEIQHGCTPYGKAKYRVVFANDQRERRFGVYNEFHGDLFIRQIKGLQETPKYPYLKNMWVLEVWMSPEKVFCHDIPETQYGSYEPLFSFQDDKGNPIPVIPDIVHKMIWCHQHPQLPGDRASDLKEQERKEFENEVSEMHDILSEEGRTWIGHRLQSGEAIIKP